MLIVPPNIDAGPNAPLLASLRATPLGESLEAASEAWQLEEIRPTTYATHFALTHARAELRVAVAGGVVVEEDWHVAPEPEGATADAIEDRLSDLSSEMTRVEDGIGRLLAALRRSPDDSGPHPSWTHALAPALAQLGADVGELDELLGEAQGIADDAAEDEAGDAADDEDEDEDEDEEEPS